MRPWLLRQPERARIHQALRIECGFDGFEQVPGLRRQHLAIRIVARDLPARAAEAAVEILGAAAQLRDRAYKAVSKIGFEGAHYRKDIAAKALMR